MLGVKQMEMCKPSHILQGMSPVGKQKAGLFQIKGDKVS